MGDGKLARALFSRRVPCQCLLASGLPLHLAGGHRMDVMYGVCVHTQADAPKNKSLSDSLEPALALQGIGWLTRKAIGVATVTQIVRQYEGPPSPPSTSAEPATHIDIEQRVTGGIQGTSEERCIDWLERGHTDWLFGTVAGKSRWMAAADIDDAFLAGGWLEGEHEAAGPAGETHLYSMAASQDGGGWVAVQVWGFRFIDGLRYYARNILVTKADERVEVRLVYDYLP